MNDARPTRPPINSLHFGRKFSKEDLASLSHEEREGKKKGKKRKQFD